MRTTPVSRGELGAVACVALPRWLRRCLDRAGEVRDCGDARRADLVIVHHPLRRDPQDVRVTEDGNLRERHALVRGCCSHSLDDAAVARDERIALNRAALVLFRHGLAVEGHPELRLCDRGEVLPHRQTEDECGCPAFHELERIGRLRLRSFPLG